MPATPSPQPTRSSASSSPADAPARRVRVQHLARAKREGRRLTMLTAYDALTAPILESAGVDMLLVGDSLGNVVLGHGSTLPVTLEDMERATGAVARSTSRVLVVADMPFGTYEASPEQAFASAVRLMRAGAHAVKLEGGAPRAAAVRLLTDGGIPVVGHLGYTPQSENTIGGPRLRGRGDQAQPMLDDARALEEAGAVAVVLEMVPADVAAQVTRALSVPTIGIGAGPDTDGQVLVWADMAGMTAWTPSFVRRFGELGEDLRRAASSYVRAVSEGAFPAEENFHRH
ncbi:MAG: 3-methyl-2-oxobutanoate hydroxymethyltransferase [Actinomyces sp.]|nr:3-methyl-2-oxobutanoate hydroxymethyltransferase [Actinomyces sp.]MCI1642536.1 3-methyl-2-oxobutanoate hydroxymethyltransferase [Actinomyces sp.]MCI1663130.1 3-methyl-2-oxobutanoate hydroxymethyltransferase [Actinomyces sp.]MCI1691284.1 3-methyl-2-oxobutanoate hydroxymethyltransferase [Actinomyces sp.]MCI1787687.1 3-methyl-2-oxobutanoate hydroxymethyltransferase [Actinomyces sp.]MCI1830405.1 3-methyl-2-oxobutanoate hydroxymethyltransferase [Actinomyces sp.]